MPSLRFDMHVNNNNTNRSLLIDLMIAKNPKLDRSQLEKLSDYALVEQAKAAVPHMSSLFSVDMLQGNLEVRSSAPYSEGSSDRAMLSSSANDGWKRCPGVTSAPVAR